VVNEGSVTQDLVWENMQNYKRQRKNVMGSVGPQGAAKHVTDIVDIFGLLFSKEVIDTIVTETNRYAQQFVCGRELSVRSHGRAWEPVMENFILYWFFYAYGHYPETYCQVVF
jgi:hypothetical protein